MYTVTQSPYLLNSLNIINGFCRDVEEGEYIMPKHSLRNGILIAESIVEIKENSRGLAQSCAVLAVNVSNHDTTVTDNAMLGSLIKYDAANVVSESFLCNVEDSIRSEHNHFTNDGGGRKPSSINCSSDFCEDSTTYKSLQDKNKIDNLRANEANVTDNDCGKKADSASSPSGYLKLKSS